MERRTFLSVLAAVPIAALAVQRRMDVFDAPEFEWKSDGACYFAGADGIYLLDGEGCRKV